MEANIEIGLERSSHVRLQTSFNRGIKIVFFLLHTQAEMTPMRTLVLINIQLFVLDVQVCSNPWILIAMSRSVRRELWSYIPLTPRPIKADADRAFSVRTVTNNGHSVRHTHSSVP